MENVKLIETAVASQGHSSNPSSRGRQAVAIHDFMPAWIATLCSQ